MWARLLPKSCSHCTWLPFLLSFLSQQLFHLRVFLPSLYLLCLPLFLYYYYSLSLSHSLSLSLSLFLSIQILFFFLLFRSSVASLLLSCISRSRNQTDHNSLELSFWRLLVSCGRRRRPKGLTPACRSLLDLKAFFEAVRHRCTLSSFLLYSIRHLCSFCNSWKFLSGDSLQCH